MAKSMAQKVTEAVVECGEEADMAWDDVNKNFDELLENQKVDGDLRSMVILSFLQKLYIFSFYLF